MRYISPLLFAAVMAAPIPHALAQERVAAGDLDVQASWTALKNLADAANNQAKIATITADSAVKKADTAQATANTARSEAANAQTTANSALTKANRIETCGRKGMIYAPGIAGTDKDACKAAGSSPKQLVLTATGGNSASVSCPAGTLLTGCTGSRHPDLSDTCEESDCGYIGALVVGKNTCKVGIDTGKRTTATVTAVCLKF